MEGGEGSGIDLEPELGCSALFLKPNNIQLKLNN